MWPAARQGNVRRSGRSRNADTVERVKSAASIPDGGRLAAYLRGRLPGVGERVEVEPLGGGQSNPTFLLTAGAQRYALRTKPGRGADLLPSAHQIEREFRVLAALAGTGVPVPRVQSCAPTRT